MPIPLLPYLDEAPYQMPFVDPRSGMLTDAWQRWLINMQRVIFGTWTDVPFSAANFTTFSALIDWDVIESGVAQLIVWQMGPIAIVAFQINTSTVSSDIDGLRISIPTLRAIADPGDTVYPNVCIVHETGSATEPGNVYMDNVGAATPVRINIEKFTGADYLAASANIRVAGVVIFQCQSIVVP
jgi:hypothetical protein